ncbi:MAG: FAD-dependent oxidoreductase [Myxococcota bacterium]
MSSDDAEFVVVGAGISGLAVAGALRDRGRSVVVVDKANGVGGRCATRRLEGQPVDLGPAFLHGSNPAFVERLRALPADERVDGWPHRVAGPGGPCQARALDPGELRIALRSGLTALPKALAAGLRVELGSAIPPLRRNGGQWVVGERRAEAVILAVPAAQARALLAAVEDDAVRSASALLGFTQAVPCLCLAALYPLDTPDPGFDLFQPGLDSPLQLVSHDSTKRRDPAHRALVLQGRPAWSRARLDAPPAGWAAELLGAAASSVGPWVERPTVTHPHRWRFARLDQTPPLRHPVVIGAGPRLGLAGEAFSELGGIQGAYLSGIELAARLLE